MSIEMKDFDEASEFKFISFSDKECVVDGKLCKIGAWLDALFEVCQPVTLIRCRHVQCLERIVQHVNRRCYATCRCVLSGDRLLCLEIDLKGCKTFAFLDRSRKDGR